MRAAFDPERETIGLTAEPSAAFDEGKDTRAKIEVLAAIIARSNAIAADVIRIYAPEDAQRKELYEHFASLKEQMLNDMLQEVNRGASA